MEKDINGHAVLDWCSRTSADNGTLARIGGLSDHCIGDRDRDRECKGVELRRLEE